jgi:hypothetical protein
MMSPAMVDWLRSSGEEMRFKVCTSSGYLRATSSDCSTSAMVVMAPMASPPAGVSRMNFSSSICLMSTRYFGDALSRFLSRTRRSVPPA